METWLIRIVTSYSQHPMCCIYVLYNECLQLQQPFLLLSVSWWGRDYLYVQWFSYYIPYFTQITILIFHISACIYQCISNRWKKLHQLIMETVQRRSILDITRGFELQPLQKKQLSLVGIANRCFPNQNIFKKSKISESSFHFFSSECYVWPTELII